MQFEKYCHNAVCCSLRCFAAALHKLQQQNSSENSLELLVSTAATTIAQKLK